MSKFQIILTGIFCFCIVVGIGLFALSKATSSAQVSNVLVWGTVSRDAFDAAFKNSSLQNNKTVKVAYVEKKVATFDSEFVNALADGIGPDLVILREDYIYKNRSKLFTIPYANYSARAFKDTFIEEGEMFLAPSGVVALPFIVDPLVMYWNRDLFSNALVSEPPKYWDEVYSLVPKLTKKDSNSNVLQSVVALGEWRNILNAKEIVANLLLQAGTPITTRNADTVVSVLNEQFNYPTVPSESAINFYTQFSNPTSPAYSWNRSLPNSFNMFLSGNLATYLGFASEIFSIQEKNANLNFDVTYVPQIRDSAKKTVFGHMYALAIVKQSKQIGGAFITMNGLTEATALTALEQITNLPPVRRDLLAHKPTDAFRTVFYNSALLAHSWIDPDAAQSSATFRDMIESITSGKSRISEALSRAGDELTKQLK
jgi:ABC-type glycerol-3-phosphate transport system substrate-binding protein